MDVRTVIAYSLERPQKSETAVLGASARLSDYARTALDCGLLHVRPLPLM